MYKYKMPISDKTKEESIVTWEGMKKKKEVMYIFKKEKVLSMKLLN